MAHYKSYIELANLKTFEERLDYLKLNGTIGRETFGSHRYLNQRFYTSADWRRFRREIILRDNGCDLGIDDGDHDIHGKIIIHHINPIKITDFSKDLPRSLMDPNNVICVSHITHEAIHYGTDEPMIFRHQERKPNDTVPWRQ